MAKRNSAGPFAAGPVVQGDWGTGDTNGDLLTFPLGSAVSGYFYSQFDRRQGTVVLWYTPEYNSATDTGIYTLLSYGTEVGLEFYYHSGAGVKKFYAGVGGQIASSAAKTLTAGTTYNYSA